MILAVLDGVFNIIIAMIAVFDAVFEVIISPIINISLDVAAALSPDNRHD